MGEGGIMGAEWVGLLTSITLATWDIPMKYTLFVFGKDPVSVLCEYFVAERSMID